MGERRYGDFASPEGAIYRRIVTILREDQELNRIGWYIYDYDNDEDIEDEVPPEGKIPAIQVVAANLTREEYSNDLENAMLSLDIIAWIDGNHVEDAWGIRNAVYRALMLQRLTDVFSSPWVAGIVPGPIDQITRGLMRSAQTVQITYLIEHPRR